jgi:two-component system chemotaxis response regulator CheB
MGERAIARGHDYSARTFQARHDDAQRAALIIRRLLQNGELNGEGMSDVLNEG